MHKFVPDIGIAAYLMMNGFRVLGRRGKNIYFEAENIEAEKEFDRLHIEYLSSPYHQFDHYLMALKKLPDNYLSDAKAATRFVPDIGIGAYEMMHGFKVLGRKGRNVYFAADDDAASKEFDRLHNEFLSSPYHQFDHFIMALKKLGDYMPDTSP